jgi:tetratricopeptide (TPR) repeat protein
MKRVVLFLLLIIVLAVFTFSQDLSGRGKLKGRVLDAKTGQPVAGVTIRLFSVRANAFYYPNPKSDSDGYWKALFLRTGIWNIDYEKDGYEAKKISYNINDAPGAKQPEIEVKLDKIEGLVMNESLVADLDKGNRLFNEKKYQEALASYETVMKSNPDVFIIWKNIGNCYFAMEDYPTAVECYEKAYAKQPNSIELPILIGNAYVNAKDSNKAIEWYQKVPVEQIRDITSLYNLGVIFYNMQKYDQAVTYFKQAVEIDPQFADGHYQLGLTLTAQNNIPAALEALKKFMELAPDSPNFQTAKAIVDAFSKVK